MNPYHASHCPEARPPRRSTRRSCAALLLIALAAVGCPRRDADQPLEPPRDERLPAADDRQPPAAPPAVAGQELDPTVKPRVLSDEQLGEGWIALFDGHSLFGWQADSAADWRVDDGQIVVASGEPGLLRTTTDFGDYELRVEFRAPAQTNSGLFLHVGERAGPADVERHLYEVNVAPPDNPYPTGSLVGRQRTDVEVQIDPDEWHTLHVTLQAGHLHVRLNDQSVLDYHDPEPLYRGAIGLQFNQGEVRFRQVHLRPLNLDSLFNGQDLTGWNEYPELDSRFTVTDEGHLNVRGGRGQLETELAFGDFVLQLECISYGDELNSGIFFRSIPGSVMDGYESQIHSGFEGDDRTRPIDYGTGGIFRRQEARRVVADDHEWFYKTIVAHGPQMAVWVNGYQVADWTDTREPDENPRRGLRREPGTIMIQGYDDTTNLSFRNLRAAEMVPR